MAQKRKILFVCDKNERTSFGRLTINLLEAVREKFDAHVLWLKTPKFFPGEVAKKSTAGPVADARGFTAHEIWAKSLYTGFFSFPSAFRKVLREVKPDFIFFIRPELGFLVKESIAAVWEATTVMFVHDTFAETLYPHSIKCFIDGHGACIIQDDITDCEYQQKGQDKQYPELLFHFHSPVYA